MVKDTAYTVDGFYSLPRKLTHEGARVPFIILLWLIPDDFTHQEEEPWPLMSYM